jgi:hypothetical protein
MVRFHLSRHKTVETNLAIACIMARIEISLHKQIQTKAIPPKSKVDPGKTMARNLFSRHKTAASYLVPSEINRAFVPNNLNPQPDNQRLLAGNLTLSRRKVAGQSRNLARPQSNLRPPLPKPAAPASKTRPGMPHLVWQGGWANPNAGSDEVFDGRLGSCEG